MAYTNTIQTLSIRSLIRSTIVLVLLVILSANSSSASAIHKPPAASLTEPDDKSAGVIPGEDQQQQQQQQQQDGQTIQGRSVVGWDLGGGLSVHLDQVNPKGAKSLLERHAVRLDFHGVGVRIGKAIGANDLDVGFYADKDEDQAREEKDGDGGKGGGGKGGGKKGSDYLLHAILGFNLTGFIALTMAAFGALVLKSLAIAKFALLIAGSMMIKKLFSSHGKNQHQIEMMDMHQSEVHPMYSDYSPNAGVSLAQHYGLAAQPGASGAGGSYLAYANYSPSGAGTGGATAAASSSDTSADTSQAQYVLAEPPGALAGALTQSQQQVQGMQAMQAMQGMQRRRGDERASSRRQPHYVTVKKYSKIHNE